MQLSLKTFDCVPSSLSRVLKFCFILANGDYRKSGEDMGKPDVSCFAIFSSCDGKFMEYYFYRSQPFEIQHFHLFGLVKNRITANVCWFLVGPKTTSSSIVLNKNRKTGWWNLEKSLKSWNLSNLSKSYSIKHMFDKILNMFR